MKMPKASLHIRTHKPGDPGWIISQHGEIYVDEFGFDPYFEIHIANKFVRFFGPEKKSFDTLWIAEMNGERAGSIAVWQKDRKKAFINFVIVLDQFRGHQIGQELLEKVLNHCREHEFTCIELETYSCLTAARKMYEKAGFEITSIEKDLLLFGRKMDREFWELSL